MEKEKPMIFVFWKLVGLNSIPVNEITISLETLTVQGIQALDPNDNYCPKQPIFQNTAQCVGVAAVSALL